MSEQTQAPQRVRFGVWLPTTRMTLGGLTLPGWAVLVGSVVVAAMMTTRDLFVEGLLLVGLALVFELVFVIRFGGDATGRTLADRLLTALSGVLRADRGETTFNSGLFSTMPADAITSLPGLLANLREIDGTDGLGRPFTLLHDPSIKTLTAVLSCNADGTDMQTQHMIDRDVVAFGGWISSLSADEALAGATVVVESALRDKGPLVERIVSDIDPDAPEVARRHALEAGEELPAKYSEVATWVTLSWSIPPWRCRSRTPWPRSRPSCPIRSMRCATPAAEPSPLPPVNCSLRGCGSRTTLSARPSSPATRCAGSTPGSASPKPAPTTSMMSAKTHLPARRRRVDDRSRARTAEAANHRGHHGPTVPPGRTGSCASGCDLLPAQFRPKRRCSSWSGSTRARRPQRPPKPGTLPPDERQGCEGREARKPRSSEGCRGDTFRHGRNGDVRAGQPGVSRGAGLKLKSLLSQSALSYRFCGYDCGPTLATPRSPRGAAVAARDEASKRAMKGWS